MFLEMTKNNLKNRTVSALVWKFGERIGAQIVRMLIMIVMARLLMPEDYGALALVMVFISICDIIVVSGLASPLVQKKDADALDFSTIFYSSLVLSVVLIITIFFIAPAIADFYEMEILCPVLRVLSIGIIFSSIGSVQNAFVSRSLKFKTFFFASLIGLVLSGISGIFLAYLGYGIWALVGQYLTNLFVNMIVVSLFIRWRPTKTFSWQRFKVMWPYGWKVFIAALINNIFIDLRTILVGKFYTKQDLAYFNQGNQYPKLVVSTVDATIISVLFPAIAKIQDDLTAVRAFLRRSIKLGSYILCPLLFGFSAMAEPLVRLILTDKWLPSVPYIQVMSIALCLSPISAPSQQAIKAIGLSNIMMKQEIIKKSFGLITTVIGVCISVWGVVIATAINQIWYLLVNTFPCKKYLGYSFHNQLFDIFPNLLCSGLMAGAVFAVKFLLLSPLMTLIIQIPLGFIIYIVLSKLSKNESYLYLRKEAECYINKFKNRILRKNGSI